MSNLLQNVAAVIAILGYLYVSAKYIFQGLIAWREKNKAEAAFILDMKHTQLPHIYETLRAVCFRLKIPYEEPISGTHKTSNT